MAKVRGRFSQQEDSYIKANYLVMTDSDIAKALNRSFKSVVNRRVKLRLMNKNDPVISNEPTMRPSVLASLDEEAKKKFFRKELHRSSLFEHVKSVLTDKEIKFYEDKYIEFMLDPTIETMTTPERDALHEMTMAQINIFRLMESEKEQHNTGNHVYSKAKEIEACQKIIQSCRQSLNVERRQRLGKQSDNAVTFTNIIKELKDPAIRREIGYEAAMLKYIGEKWYNEHMNTNIISGQPIPIDIAILFQEGVVPSGLSADFTDDYKDK